MAYILGCGQLIGLGAELFNGIYERIALVGGRSLVSARLEPALMECGLCGKTDSNFLGDHPAIKGRTGVVEVCNSCGCKFTSKAVARNPYGEDLQWVLERHNAYEGKLELTVTRPPHSGGEEEED